MKLGPVIRRLRHVKGWTLQKMCDEMDFVIQPGHLSRIERDEQNPSANILTRIAQVLNVSIDSMISEACGGQSASITTKDPARYIPVISWVLAGSWADIPENISPEECGDWVMAPRRLPGNCFGLRVRGDSMQAPHGMSFPEGCVIIVAANQRPENKSYVVAMQNNSQEATFKQLVMEGGEQYLKPLNPQYPIMPVREDTVICGVVVAMVCDLTGKKLTER